MDLMQRIQYTIGSSGARLFWTISSDQWSSGYDEYSLLYSTRDFFSLLVPYSEILLLGRVASNSNKSSNDENLDDENKPDMFSCII